MYVYKTEETLFFFQIQILQILAQNVRVIADGTQTFLQIIK